MKSPFLLCVTVGLVVPSAAPAAQPTPPTPTPPAVARSTQPPPSAVLNLPRLKHAGTGRLDASRFTVDPLNPQPANGALAVTREDLRSLQLAPAREWSRPLRGKPQDTVFVSFLAYPSIGSTFDIGGARLTIAAGAKAGQARLLAGSGPQAITVKLETHGGARLAALPVLTLRLDPPAGTWDLFSFNRLIAADLPLSPAKGARQFSVHPGSEGASLVSLVVADDNPLFVDANANGIDDTFEKSARNGTMLAATAPAADRRKLTAEWIAAQHQAKSPAWRIRRPAPDGTAASRPATPGG
jgi:hypothetical protein